MKISASTNPPSLDKMLDYIGEISPLNIDYVHCDVMDGEFVESKTFDFSMLKDIHKVATKPLDVHLMVDNIENFYSSYMLDGVEIISIHFEALQDKSHLPAIIKNIKSSGKKFGLAICPDTDFEEILPFIESIDLLLVMSVVPGKSYQKFIDATIPKLQKIIKYRKEHDLHFLIEVDGGVNAENVQKLKSMGVDMVVIGGYLYSSDKRENIIKNIKD